MCIIIGGGRSFDESQFDNVIVAHFVSLWFNGWNTWPLQAGQPAELSLSPTSVSGAGSGGETGLVAARWRIFQPCVTTFCALKENRGEEACWPENVNVQTL